MRYHGGKSRVGKRISVILKKIIQDNDSMCGYCEPFCGGCGVLCHMTDDSSITVSAGDANPSLIMMWKELCEGWVPSLETVTRERYLELKGNGMSSPEKGFLGHIVSYGGLYFKTFTDSLVERLPSSRKNLVQKSRDLRNVEFSEGDYRQFGNLTGCVIFCDPPYAKNSRYFDEYNRVRRFDTESFWEWCIEMSAHNIIVVNEMAGIENGGDWRKIDLPARNVRYKGVVTSSAESLYILDRINSS